MQQPPAAALELTGVQRLLDLARTHLGMEVAWLSEFGSGQQVIRATSGDADAMHVSVGTGTPLEGSFCVRVVAGTLPPVIPDARRHLGTRDLDVTRELGIGSYVGAPVHGADGRVTGMLCCLSRSASPGLDPDAGRYAALVADLVSDHLASAAVAEERSTRRAREAVEDVLDRGAVRAVFQPVVSLDGGRVVGYEALARFDAPGFPTPDRAFAAATRAGLGVELELLAVRRAVAELEQVPPGARLAVNLSADALVDADVQDVVLGAAARARRAGRGLCVEVTEHTQVADYPALVEATAGLRQGGATLAVDDAGAGYASLRHILRLQPDTIKADVELVRGVDADPARQALLRSLVSFAAEVGAGLVAEGVETEAERDALLGLGVPFAQGFLHGRPGPLPGAAAGAGSVDLRAGATRSPA